MTANFQLLGLAREPFEHLFDLSDEALQKQDIVRRVVTVNPGFPCRISLEDAEVGEEVLLLPYEHQAVASPYRASGPIFIRRNATQSTVPAGEVPSYVSLRQISVRAYDADDMMIAANVCKGVDVAEELDRQFNDSKVAYVHLHNAKPGCFSCKVVRATPKVE